ncbi:MAG TPA: cation:proton antiporter [Pirellulales bacterium]|jgi:Kef-type K+ transport system membrane component KefB
MNTRGSLEDSGVQRVLVRGAPFLGTAVAYTVMILSAVGAMLLIRSYGNTLTAPVAETAHASSNAATQSDIVLRVLIALTAIIVAGQVAARLFSYIGQPPVIGEVIVGILLGPSLIGPERSAMILPASVAPYLGIIAQLGVILYMFLVGLELNAGLLKRRAHATVAISHASILTPFVLGAALALCLYPRLSSSDVTFSSFALFMGAAMSITAFPVLARIITDRGMTKTHLGVVALGCAATDDVTAWCLLAFVVGVANSQMQTALMVLAGTAAYILAMVFVVRPIVSRLAAQWDAVSGDLPRPAVVFVVIAMLLSALSTELIGIHAIFGAFMLGAILPHNSAVARGFVRQVEPIVTVLLLPAFFAYTGMRTRIDLVTGLNEWLICGIIIAIATLGKFGGTLTAGGLTGLSWREAGALGILMNTRGLMELIVLNIGLDLGVISPKLFAMMVIMALVTTLGTAPVLRLILPAGAPKGEPQPV